MSNETLLKRTFKGETLESYVEAARCKTLNEFEDEKNVSGK